MSEVDGQFRCDVQNAVNLLIHQGRLPKDTEYSFVARGGRVLVRLWLVEPGDPSRLRWEFFEDPKSLIVSAGPLNVVRGGAPK